MPISSSSAHHRQRADVLVGHQLNRFQHRLFGLDGPDVLVLESQQVPDAQHRGYPPCVAAPTVSAKDMPRAMADMPAGRFLAEWSAVVMSARPVDVAVRQLFLGRGAHFGDLDVEIEILTRERMIAVDRDHVADDLRDRHGARAAFRLRVQLHADVEVADALRARGAARAGPATCRTRRSRRRGAIFTLSLSPADLPSSSRSRPGIRLPLPCRYASGSPPAELSSVLPVVVGQRVVNQNDGVLGDLHDGFPNYSTVTDFARLRG